MKRSLTIAMTLLSVLGLSACGGGGGTGVAGPGKTTVYRAFVANGGDNTVTGYSIDKTSGALTSTGTVTVGSLPNSVTVDPQGRFAYAANLVGNSVSAFSIDAVSGALTSAGTVTTGGNTMYANIDPLSRFLYAPNWNTNDAAIFTINAATGALTRTDCGGGAGCNGANYIVGSGPASNVAFDPAGRYAYIALQGSNLVARFVIDQTTGALSSSVTATAGAAPGYVTVDPRGKFSYVANMSSNDISAYIVSASTGTLSQIDCGGGAGCNGKNFVAGQAPTVLAMDPAGKFLYCANYNDNTISAYTIDAATGALAAVSGSPYTVDGKAYGDAAVAVDPSGRFLYATSVLANTVVAFAIDITTGQLTPLASSPFVAGAGPYFVTTAVTSY